VLSINSGANENNPEEKYTATQGLGNDMRRLLSSLDLKVSELRHVFSLGGTKDRNRQTENPQEDKNCAEP